MTGSGPLKDVITIQRATVTYNSFGEEVEIWATLKQVYARRKDASASEAYKSQEVGGKLAVRFFVRYGSEIADVNPRDRVSFDGDIYNIIGVRITDRNRWMEIDTSIQPDIAAAAS